ncbi:FG-GAP-like repeat-containing protein [Hymenobacter nivis]|uniref:T9SS C-terminal target domain-containing protein n=1 Tax=Hymenobacter nivis TaxID=1850093 RepID=A0A502GX72_9BACT|nr:FG-GAP-like repeat-containing protein [Hymenobacter nivis]TPG66601.1 hypothetical protein EAH73_09410 [Hymenobacter nivis]
MTTIFTRTGHQAEARSKFPRALCAALVGVGLWAGAAGAQTPGPAQHLLRPVVARRTPHSATAFKPGETALTTFALAGPGARTQGQAAPAAGAGTGRFRGGSEVPVGNTPVAAALGDVDGDGDRDLVVANGSSATVSIRLNNGIGGFGGGREVPVYGQNQGLALGDVDGDGDLDLVTANNGGIASVRLNNGAGVFSGGQDVVLASNDQPVAPALADVDGDGDLDLLVTEYGGRVSIRQNNGRGFFSGNQEVFVGQGPTAIAVGDVDGDGDLDFATSSALGSTASVRLNNGRGVFAGGQDVPVDDSTEGIALGDVDGDGDLDLLATAYNEKGSADVRLNDGHGTFSGNRQVSIGSYPNGLALGDVDGDGDLDLVATYFGSGGGGGGASVRLNDGTGTFASGQEVPTGDIPNGVALGDVDGDGDLDLVTANLASNTASVRLNQPAPVIVSVAPAPASFRAPRTTPVAATFDQLLNTGPATRAGLKVFSQQAGGLKAGTGAVSGNTLTFQPATAFKPGETVFATVTPAVQTRDNQNPAAPYVFQFTTAAGVGPGVFRAGYDPAVDASSSGVALGDVDGDGDLDLVTVSRVYFNTGVGTFVAGPAVSVVGSPLNLTLGDVDGDGDLDLLVTANTGRGIVNVRLNDGRGTFSGSQQVSVGFKPFDVALGDVDGDGDLDIVTANQTGSSASIRLNNGTGTFSGEQQVLVGDQPVSVALGDVDGDGDLDFVTTSASGTTASVRLNNGAGAFSGDQDVAVGFNPFDVALGDVDGDGDLDLVTANRYNYNSIGQIINSTVSLRLNNGHGAFAGGREVPVGGGASNVALGDVDGDGDLDLVATSGGAANVRVNDGAGAFSGNQDVANVYAQSLVLGDVDGDGDLDIVTEGGNSATVSVRLNQAEAPASAFYRLRAGGGALATSRGQFAEDQYFSAASATFATTAAIAGTPDPALYQQERFSTNGTLSYALPVANGPYTVVLHFAELYWTKPGQRVFDINLEGKKVATNYDIVRKVGPLAATTETFTVAVADGVLNIDLSVPYLSGGADQAKLSALEVLSPDGRTPQLASAPQLANAALRGSAAGPLSGLSTYPNPAQNAFTLACTATKAQAATLLLSGPLGNVLLQQAVALQAGSNLVPVRAPNLAAGLYQLTLRLPDGQHQSQRIIIQP